MDEFESVNSIKHQLAAIDHMDDQMVAAMRALTISEKLHLVGKINREVRRRVKESVRTRNPHWSEEGVQAEFLHTMLSSTYESLIEFMPTNVLDL